MKGIGSRHGWVIVAVGLLAAVLLYIFVRPAYQFAGLLGLLIAMFGLVVVVPKLIAPDHPKDSLSGINEQASLQQNDERLKLQNDIRTTLLQAATGIALLVGVFLPGSN